MLMLFRPWLCNGINEPLFVTSGSEAFARFSRVGIEGPKTSVSRMPVRKLCLEKAKARLTARVDFPTPPLALDTAMT